MSFGSKSLPPPTPEEWERMGRCKELPALGSGPSEYHHVLVNGHRMGHRFGYGLPPELHREISLNAKAFHAQHGSDQELQDRQDDLLNLPRVTIPKGRREARAIGAMAKAKPFRKARRGSQCVASAKACPRPSNYGKGKTVY